MKLLRGLMRTKHKGATIIELILVLGIMALISICIATILNFTITLNNEILSVNNKEYKSHEFFRYVSNSIKNFRTTNIIAEERKISVFYEPAVDKSDKIDILQHNDNIYLIYYDEYAGNYTRTSTRVILEQINGISFRIDRNLLYVKILWKDGEISLGVIDL